MAAAVRIAVMSAAREELAVKLRPMTPWDVVEVGRIERAAYRYPWSTGMFRDCLLAGYTCMVLDDRHEVIGYGIMSVAAREGHVINVCVHPDRQGQGHGRRMMEALLEHARAEAAERVFLEVRPSNRVALNLYRRLGFREIGIRPRYYQAEGGREDAVVLCLEFTAGACGE